MDMADKTVEIAIASIERSHLSVLLTAVHRGGFGHLTRVLDPARGDVAGQLRRAGAVIPDGFVLGESRVAVMISAPARVTAASELLERHGAQRVWTVERAGASAPLLLDNASKRNRSRLHQASEPVAD